MRMRIMVSNLHVYYAKERKKKQMIAYTHTCNRNRVTRCSADSFDVSFTCITSSIRESGSWHFVRRTGSSSRQRFSIFEKLKLGDSWVVERTSEGQSGSIYRFVYSCWQDGLLGVVWGCSNIAQINSNSRYLFILAFG